MVRLRDRALGTSSAQFQSFRRGGRRYGHILDPRSGRPAEGVLSTTVAAPTAAVADALSTAFYVMGPEPSLAYCRTRPEIGLVMACPGRQGRDVETFTAGIRSGRTGVLPGLTTACHCLEQAVLAVNVRQALLVPSSGTHVRIGRYMSHCSDAGCSEAPLPLE